MLRQITIKPEMLWSLYYEQKNILFNNDTLKEKIGKKEKNIYKIYRKTLHQPIRRENMKITVNIKEIK